MRRLFACSLAYRLREPGNSLGAQNGDTCSASSTFAHFDEVLTTPLAEGQKNEAKETPSKWLPLGSQPISKNESELSL